MSKPMTTPGDVSEAGRGSGRRTALASLAAISSVLAASSCCWPVLPFVVGAGLAGGSAFFAALRPYLLGASVLLIAYGFYAAGRAKKCRQRPSVIASVLLWVSTLFVVVSILFPQALASAAANWLAR